MVIGIIPNTRKENIDDILNEIVSFLEKNSIQYFISKTAYDISNKIKDNFDKSLFLDANELIEKSEVVISIGGDGTLLNAAYKTRKSETPIAGVNFGKLGFLAEYDISKIEDLILDIKSGNYIIEKRPALSAISSDPNESKLYAINDIVIDKGPWPKMIEITIKVDGTYVSTFSADGLIIATPTGSTGYSLSTGGPIVNPDAKVILLSPISPHTLTMRPLVLSDDQDIEISANSLHKSIQVNCDGQRAYQFETPVSFEIKKSSVSLNLLHAKSFDYFSVLRDKLFWGLDIRNKRSREL